MNALLLIGGVTWTLLLGVWAYRLSAHDIYANKAWVWLWIAGRLLLRFVLGMALLWAFLAANRLSPPAYRILIIDAHLPEAWDRADTLLRQRYSDIRTGVLALKGSQAIWVLPPTRDLALFRWLKEIRPQRPLPFQSPEKGASVRYLTALSPYLPFTRQIVWVGARLPPHAPENLHILWCEKTPPKGHTGPVFYNALELPPPEKPLSERRLALVLAGGIALLLLLGDGLMIYILRYDLPLN